MMKREKWVWLFCGILLLSAGCSTAEFHAIPSHDDIRITSDGKMATISKENIAISVRRVQTPNRMGNRITTFRVALINQSDKHQEFVPKEFLLLDQHGRQFYALPKEALGRGAYIMGGRETFVSAGYGYGHYSFHNPWWFHGHTHYVGPTFTGMVSNALPTGPIRIFPRAIVEGNLYFNVSYRELESIRVQITRLKHIPKDRSDRPKEYEYVFPFRVLK